jgi:hypothetical protein
VDSAATCWVVSARIEAVDSDIAKTLQSLEAPHHVPQFHTDKPITIESRLVLTPRDKKHQIIIDASIFTKKAI